MPEPESKDEQPTDALTRIADVLEAVRFNDGSLDLTLQGPETGLTGSPLVMKLYIVGDAVDKIAWELSEIASGLQAIADAIGGPK